MKYHCPNGHQLWQSWTGTTGCTHAGCEHERTQHPSEEIVCIPRTSPRSCGHQTYMGWGPVYGCRIDGCPNYLPGIDVSRKGSAS